MLACTVLCLCLLEIMSTVQLQKHISPSNAIALFFSKIDSRLPAALRGLWELVQERSAQGSAGGETSAGGSAAETDSDYL